MAEHPVQVFVYALVVSCGIFGNALVLWIAADSTRENRYLASSDLILMNIAAANLMISLTRNTLLLTFDAGQSVSFSDVGCRLMMFIWTWLRSAGIWVTLSLSLYHFITIRTSRTMLEKLSERRKVVKALVVEWVLNLVYASFALPYSSNSKNNSTNNLTVISSTIRPLLGCVWTFPNESIGLTYAMVSVVIHEAIPVSLMIFSNSATLLFLYKHHRKTRDVQFSSVHGSTEWKAAKTILYLILLFIVSWGTHVISVNYYNFNGSPSTRYMLIIARFSASGFVGFYPLVVASGHSKLRKRMRNILKCGCLNFVQQK
ncbi:olfactory receptor class A-like protein 4 [Scyliorhinus canicula]|uniref:olfactory receptor class A-like protein 4 n=1 Tax=Scyliorhinus canicula TaxID=7830 RepID=UPI0018F2FDD6|nr:olfactory receptor class A-like protein 4 [Scyliorhinus canicula]